MMTEEEQIKPKKQALDQIKRILGEHFEGYVLAVETEIDDPINPENDGNSRTFVCYGGGFNRAYGLALRAKRQFDVNGYIEELHEDENDM